MRPPIRVMDTQTIELVGRNQLTAELLRAGLEVALPLRDRGIDLIAYADTGADVATFTAVPIQMKVASERSFSINRKYEKFPNLLHAYVWGIQVSECLATYALTQPERLLSRRRWVTPQRPRGRTMGRIRPRDRVESC